MISVPGTLAEVLPGEKVAALPTPLSNVIHFVSEVVLPRPLRNVCAHPHFR